MMTMEDVHFFLCCVFQEEMNHERPELKTRVS